MEILAVSTVSFAATQLILGRAGIEGSNFVTGDDRISNVADINADNDIKLLKIRAIQKNPFNKREQFNRFIGQYM